MLCKKCGKELEKDWATCPYCGNAGVNTTKNGSVVEGISEKLEDTKEGIEQKASMNLLKSLIHEHPVRSILCIPVIICIVYLLYWILTYNFHNLLHGQGGLFGVIRDFFPVIAGLMFCDVILWLLYGPKNYKEVKEKVTGEHQKGYGIVSHIIALIVAVILVLIY